MCVCVCVCVRRAERGAQGEKTHTRKGAHAAACGGTGGVEYLLVLLLLGLDGLGLISLGGTSPPRPSVTPPLALSPPMPPWD